MRDVAMSVTYLPVMFNGLFIPARLIYYTSNSRNSVAMWALRLVVFVCVAFTVASASHYDDEECTDEDYAYFVSTDIVYDPTCPTFAAFPPWPGGWNDTYHLRNEYGCERKVTRQEWMLETEKYNALLDTFYQNMAKIQTVRATWPLRCPECGLYTCSTNTTWTYACYMGCLSPPELDEYIELVDTFNHTLPAIFQQVSRFTERKKPPVSKNIVPPPSEFESFQNMVLDGMGVLMFFPVIALLLYFFSIVHPILVAGLFLALGLPWGVVFLVYVLLQCQIFYYSIQ